MIIDKHSLMISYSELNDGNYNEEIHISKDLYKKWINMFHRCYSGDVKYKTYSECEVCDEWTSLFNFCKWHNENYYEMGSERIELDKDILVKGNKIYSPETCIYAPHSVNSLFVNCLGRSNKSCPLGVKYNKKYQKYYSDISNHGKAVRLGSFDTKIEAFNAYKEAKERYIKQVADEYKDKIPVSLYNAMYNWKVEITD